MALSRKASVFGDTPLSYPTKMQFQLLPRSPEEKRLVETLQVPSQIASKTHQSKTQGELRCRNEAGRLAAFL